MVQPSLSCNILYLSTDIVRRDSQHFRYRMAVHCSLSGTAPTVAKARQTGKDHTSDGRWDGHQLLQPECGGYFLEGHHPRGSSSIQNTRRTQTCLYLLKDRTANPFLRLDFGLP